MFNTYGLHDEWTYAALESMPAADQMTTLAGEALDRCMISHRLWWAIIHAPVSYEVIEVLKAMIDGEADYTADTFLARMVGISPD